MIGLCPSPFRTSARRKRRADTYGTGVVTIPGPNAAQFGVLLRLPMAPALPL